jgi:hypothetical protein
VVEPLARRKHRCRTGRVSDLVVVDVDVTRGADPARVFEQYPTGLAARTGTGGAHLFYAYPPNAEHVSNRVGKDGIDIRADGGYVIVAPSIHPNGETYRFVATDVPGEMPEWVIGSPVEAEEDENKDKWLSELLAGCESGGRNNAAARLAGYFAAKGMAFGIAWTLLQQWNQRNHPPLPKSELKTTLSSVYKTAARNGTLEKARRAQAGEEPEETRAFEVMDFRSYMTKFGDVAVQWQIEDWIPTQTIAFCVAPPGTYKTWLTFDLALSVASGMPFLGQFKVRDPGPVLVIQQEDFHGQIAERFAEICAAKFNIETPDPQSFKGDDYEVSVAPDLPIFFHTERRLRFADATVMAALAEVIKEKKPKLVIIDPLYSAGTTDDFMAKTAEQMFVLKRLRDELGCSFLVVHHTKKSTDKDKESNGPQRESLWGSQFLNAFLETGWQIRRTDEPNAVAIKRHFKVKSDSSLLRLTFDISTEWPHKYEVVCEEMDDDSEKADLIGVLQRLGPSTAQAVADEVKLHRSSVSRRLAKLVEAGAVSKLKDGRFAVSDAPTF